MKNKKILLGLGTLATLTTPVVAAVSCGSSKSAPAQLKAWDNKYLLADAKAVFPNTMSVLQELLTAGGQNDLTGYFNKLLKDFETVAHKAGHVSYFGDGLKIEDVRSSKQKLTDMANKVSLLIQREIEGMGDMAGIAFRLIDDSNHHYVAQAAKELISAPTFQEGLMKFLVGLHLNRPSIKQKIDAVWGIIQKSIENKLMPWKNLADTEDIDMYIKKDDLSVNTDNNILESYMASGGQAENSLQSVDFKQGKTELLADHFALTALTDRVFQNVHEAPAASVTTSSKRSAGSHTRAASTGMNMESMENILKSIAKPNFQNILSGVFAFINNIDFLKDSGTTKGMISKLADIFTKEVIHEDGKSGLAGDISGENTFTNNVFDFVDWNIGRASDTVSDAAQKTKFAKFIAARDAMLNSNYLMQTEDDVSKHKTEMREIYKMTLKAGDLIPLKKTYKFKGQDVKEVKFKDFVQTYDLSMYFKLSDGLLSFVLGSMPGFGLDPDGDISEYPTIVDNALKTIKASGYDETSHKDIQLEKVITALNELKIKLSSNEWIEYAKYEVPLQLWRDQKIGLSDLPKWAADVDGLAKNTWASETAKYDEFKNLASKAVLTEDEINRMLALVGEVDAFAKTTYGTLTKSVDDNILIVAKYNTYIKAEVFRKILCAV